MIVSCKRTDPDMQRESPEPRRNAMSTAILMVPILVPRGGPENLLY